MKSVYKGVFSIVTVLLFCCQSIHLVAQNKYQKGYIITNGKDTINGFILDLKDSELSKQVLFKKTLKEKNSSTYTTNDLSEFGFNYGRTFYRFKIPENENGIDSINIFAKKLLNGKLNLYLIRLDKLSDSYLVFDNETKVLKYLAKAIDSIAFSPESTVFLRQKPISFYVNYDAKSKQEYLKSVKYPDVEFINDVNKFNLKSQKAFPAKKYDEKPLNNYALSFSFPINKIENKSAFRLSLELTRNYHEKPKTIQYLALLRYSNYHDKSDINPSIENGNIRYRLQLLNISPLGIKLQTKGNKIQGYSKTGIGLGFYKTDEYVIRESERKSDYTKYFPNLTAHIELGIQVRIKSKFVFLEYSPFTTQNMVNAGIMF